MKSASSVWSRLVSLLLLSSLGIALLLSGMYLYLAPKLPSVEALKEAKLQVPLRIYSKNLKLIGEFGEKRRIPVTLEQTPPLFIQAVIAAEDDRFYSHGGVDIQSLMRAVSELITTGEIQTGGSTITMQVARNFFLSNRQTFARKFNEILLALQIERQLSKDEILELYINKIYLGHRAYGIGAAAQVYYGKSVNELDLSELATIAGLPKAPSTINPITNPQKATERRDWILTRMLKLNYIDQAQFDEAIHKPVIASFHDLPLDTDAPYVAEMARQFALEKIGDSAYEDGYQVITTIDENLQAIAQKAVQDAVFEYDKRHGYRGPEAHVKLPEGLVTPENIPDEIRQQLKDISNIAGTVPAIIVDIKKDELTAHTIKYGNITVSWQKVRDYLAPYIDENRTGAIPESPAQTFKKGDVIRVIQTSSNHWEIRQLPRIQAALVSLNPDNGAIISLSGGFDFKQSKYNRIIQANRQPGSSFKPFFYVTALENGFTAATLINDSPVVFDDANLENAWRPENSSDEFLGPIRLRKALYNSRNLVSIRLMKAIGIDKAIEGTVRFGFIREQLPRDLSLALGSLSVPPMTIVTAYASFANGGYKIEPYLVDTILDSSNQIIYKSAPVTVCHSCEQDVTIDAAAILNDETDNTRAPRIMSSQVAYIMDSILRDVIKKGTATKALSLKRGDIAGKTGTTNGPTDVWFSGYSPAIVTTTWMGFDDNQNIGKKEYGGSAALPIWIDFMQAALSGTKEMHRPQPEGLVAVMIDEKSGLRAPPGQDNVLFEIFPSNQLPSMKEETKTPDIQNNAPEPEPQDMF